MRSIAIVGLCVLLFYCGWMASVSHNVEGRLQKQELIEITSDVVEVQCDAVTVWVVPNDKLSVSDADQIGEIIVLQDYCRRMG